MLESVALGRRRPCRFFEGARGTGPDRHCHGLLLALAAAARDEGAISGQYLYAALALEKSLAAGRSRPVPMNIDGATAVVYAELGFPPPLGRGLFVLSRSVGILAHGWEQTEQGGRNKGPIPRTLLPTYTGHPERYVEDTVRAEHCLLTVKPLNLAGGVGSPANATAIK